MKRTIYLLLLWPLLSPGVTGQPSDTATRYRHANVIKVNPTPMLLWDNLRNITLGYERTLKPNQSIAIQAGYLEFDPVFGDTLLHVYTRENKDKKGLNLAADYRFYPLKLNRHEAPRGLYIGPYVSFYGFRFTNEMDLLRPDTLVTGQFTGAFGYLNLGFQVGYQFIFWKRLAVDLLMFGPSVTCRFTRKEFDSSFSSEEIEETLQGFKERVQEKYPYLTPSLDLGSGRSTVTFQAFFRYSISVGYRF